MSVAAKMRKVKLQMGLLICLLLTLSNFNQRSWALYDYKGNLDESEVLDIVFSNPEVANWLVTHEIIDHKVWYYHSLGQWGIDLTTSDGSETIIITLVVDDHQKSVLSISYSDLSTEDTEREYIENQALIFFNSDPISDDFVNGDFEIYSSLSSRNIVYVEGRNYTSDYKRLQFSVQISYNSTPSGEFVFSFVKIQANFAFGNLTTGLDEVKDIVESKDIIIEYLSDHPFKPPNSNKEIYAVLYFQSLYHKHLPGYVYEVYYRDGTDYFIEYTGDGYVYYYGDQPDWREAINRISVQDIFIRAELNPETFDFNSVEGTYFIKNNITNILDSVFMDEQHFEWIANISPFLGYISIQYDGFVNFEIESRISADFGNFQFNVTTFELLNQFIQKSIPAKSSAEIVYLMAIQNQDIVNFKGKNEYISYSVLYDTLGTWRVEFYNPFIEFNTAQVYINDSTGEIIGVTTNILDPSPILAINDLITIVLNSDFYIHVIDFPESKLTFYLLTEGHWVANIFSILTPENSYRIRIDDSNGEIISENRYNFGTKNSSSLESFKQKVHSNPAFINFQTKYPGSYETIYFKEHWIYYTEHIRSQILIEQLILEDTAINLEATNLTTIAASDFIKTNDFVVGRDYNLFLHPRNKIYFGRGGGERFQLLDKLVTFSVSDLLEGVVDWGDTKWTLNTPSDNENGGSDLLMVSGIVVGVCVAIVILVRYRRSG